MTTRATRGSELMQKINDGRALKVPTAAIEKARGEISAEIEELLEVGARIRPLLLAGKRIGWVRGVHPSERKLLRRYFEDHLELAEHVVRIGTSLTYPMAARRLAPRFMTKCRHLRSLEAMT